MIYKSPFNDNYFYTRLLLFLFPFLLFSNSIEAEIIALDSLKELVDSHKVEHKICEKKLAEEKELVKLEKYKNQRILTLILSIITLFSILIAILVASTSRKNKLLNAQLEEKQEQLKRELKNNQGLIREIHHRVKNNLQVISSMLSIQAKYSDNETFLELITECKSRINSMALIHEHLYKKELDEDAPFSTYIKELIPTLISTYYITGGEIKLKMELEDIELSLDDSIPCSLIINEIVSNSLKHAFPDNKDGEIEVELKKEGEKISLAISDNGVGFANNIIPDSNDSFGLLLIDSLISQLGAEKKISTENGVSYHIQWIANNDKLLD